MTPLEFATGLHARGIEFVLRKPGRLCLWPGASHKYLTDAERAFIREHKAELKALAAAKVLPETTVTWNPPHDGAPESAAPLAPTDPRHCPYCGDRPCVAPDDRWFRVLHWNDPAEVARRSIEATAVMGKMMRFGHGGSL